jgi:putative ABC transport system permease protein
MRRGFLRILNAARPDRAESELAHQRDTRSFRWLDDAWLDAQYAWRTLSRTPGFSLVAVLTLALGIGATTAIFSVVNAVLLRPLPYKDSERLVRILEHVPATDGSAAPSRRAVGFLLSELIAIRSQAATLSHLGGYVGSTLLLTGRDETIRLEAARLSPAVFAMLGTQPLIGRTFDAAEETPGQDSVAVLSYASWQRYFAGARDVLDQRMTLDGRVYSIVGVMPRGFQFPDSQTQLWIPFALNGSRALPVARLADGVSIDAATAEVTAILNRMPGSSQPRRSGPRQFALERVQDELVAPVRPALRVVAVAVGFVLLIACVNVANLELARDAARQREIAVRLALGAGHARLIRQLFAESALLALGGAAAGVALSSGGVQLLRTLGASLPRGDLAAGVSIPRLEEITIDLPVLAFTLVAAIVTAILSGLAPAVRQSRSLETDVLREGASSAISGFNLLRHHRMQGVLIVAEIAMAMLLLVGGGLLIHSFVNLADVDPGYDPSGVLTFQVYSPRPRSATFEDDFVARLRSLPSARAAGYAEMLPLVRFRSGVGLRPVQGAATEPPPPAPGARLSPAGPDARVVSRDFLNAMGMRIVAGRGFGDNDRAGQPKVLLINRALASSGYLGKNPIGTRVYAAGREPWAVVGIVENVRQYGLDQEPDPQIFIDVRQLPMGNPNAYYAFRTGGDPAASIASIKGIVRQIDPRATIDNVATMERIVSNSISRQRLYAALLGIFAAVAVALAAIGIYGVIAYTVAQRTREIGIRMALGAARWSVMRLVLGQGAVLTAAGIAFGLAGAAAMTRYLDTMLFGLTPLDPATFVVVSVMFATIATLASYAPARRATKVDPLVALRHE